MADRVPPHSPPPPHVLSSFTSYSLSFYILMCASNVGAGASDGRLWVSDCENDICFSLLSLHCVDKVLI